MAIEIIDDRGVRRDYPLSYFEGLERQSGEITVEKKGVLHDYSWQGFRFDKWLEQEGYKDFRNIRVESSDRYSIMLSRYDFDRNESWMIFVENGEKLDEHSFRIIFPTLRQMYWVTGINRILLEKTEPLKMPKQFILTERALKSQKLLNDPKPFVRTSGYSLDALIKDIFKIKKAQVLMYSKDGLQMRLDYPAQLQGAIIELTPEGSYNLKSPQIPGGMWLRDIVYIQINDKAMILEEQIGKIIELNNSLRWKLEPPFEILLRSGRKSVPIELEALLTNLKDYPAATGFVLISK